MPPVAGVIRLGVHYGTYTAMVYRAGIDNIPKGQWDAAKAWDLTGARPGSTLSCPMSSMIPALANDFIAMFKETPLLSAITILETMTLAGVLSLVISIPSVVLPRRLERRFGGCAVARG